MTPQLIEKLKKAESGSRELDAEICEALDYRGDLPEDRLGRKVEAEGSFILNPGVMVPPAVSASLDAATSLVMSALDGKFPRIELKLTGTHNSALVSARTFHTWKFNTHKVHHKDPCLAILIALLMVMTVPNEEEET